MNPQTILFITNSELGQCNVHLAVAHEFLLRPEHEVHIASFPRLEEKVNDLNARALQFASSTQVGTAAFHPLDGPNCIEAIAKHTHLPQGIDVNGGCGVRAAVTMYKNELPTVLSLWNNADYLAIYDSCMRVIRQVNPSFVAIDLLLGPAIDACAVSKTKYCLLGPNTFLEHIPELRYAQPWKYPQINSGFAYPLPWTKILPNIYLALRIICAILNSRRLKSLREYRNKNNIPGPNPPFGLSVPSIIPARPDTDFPCKIPEHITCCGPILRPSKPISDEDPELARWLVQRPTVLVNLGSLVVWDAQRTSQFAEGIRVLLGRRGGIQILWKLQTVSPLLSSGDSGPDVDDGLECIRDYIDGGQVRILPWLPVDSICILQSGGVICMVHHGGSNSFHEAIQAGVPHVVLPVWFDTYDFATRAEWLGIGAWGNRSVAPNLDGGELGEALVRVVASDESVKMFLQAQEIAGKLGEGRIVACEKIIELLKL